jgi:hypothetical protein
MASRAGLRLCAAVSSALLLLAAGCTVSMRGLEVEPGGDSDGGQADDAEGDLPGSHEVPLDRAADRPPADGPPADRPLDVPMPLGMGIPCTPNGVPCASTFCVDGVCCESACAAVCQSCAAVKTGAANGLCRPVPATMDPDSECPDEGVASCKRSGGCNGMGACALYPKGSVCGAASCSGSSLTGPPTCDGAGTCDPGPPKPCVGGFVCANNQTCKTSCMVDADCMPNLGCDPMTGFCSVMKKPLGQSCALDAECVSNLCADGVCCDKPCGGRCRACIKTLTGAENGTCADIMAGIKPTRQAECPIQKNACGNDGLCNGAGGCQQFPDGTQCGTYCCSPGNNNVEFCHLLCAAGACTNQSAMVAGTCDDKNPCNRDRCDSMGTTHVCHNENGCTPPDCCCVGAGSPICSVNAMICAQALNGTCIP